jgi:hypothetical protein
MTPDMQAAFVLSGEIDPDFITQTLGIRPSLTFAKGEHIQGTALTRKKNGWVLRVQSQTGQIALDELVDTLVDPLMPAAAQINKLCLDYSLFSQISCAVTIKDETPAISFSADLLAKAASLNAGLDIDLILTE